jgi:hypothetical protein
MARGDRGSPEDRSAGADSAGYLRRAVGPAWRLATLLTGDPVAAQAVVERAAIAAWRSAGDSPDRDLDSAFERELTADLLRVTAGSEPPDDADSELAEAIGALPAGFQLDLARRFGLGEASYSPETLARLAAELGSDGLESRLAAFYAARDPGPDAPLAMRLRVQGGLADLERTTEDETRRRAERSRRGGWGFGLNVPLLMIALTATVAAASAVNVRASLQAQAASSGGPTNPLTIASMVTIQSGGGGSGASVAATRTSLVATFQPAAIWHQDIRSCLPDVAGTVGPDGKARWLGQPIGHVESMAGDPSSSALYSLGLGEYCDPEAHAGPADWAPLPMPGKGGTARWLAFDPGNAATLLAADGHTLFLSRDAGRAWSTGTETVAPLAFDASGRLFGWGAGSIFESLDDGTTWDEVAGGPSTQPAAAAALSGGLLLGGPDGLRWYPLDGSSPTLVQAGTVFSMAEVGDGAIVVGATSAGRPWLGAYSIDAAVSPFALSPLPPEVRSLTVSGGQAAANSTGALVAFSAPSSAICFVAFAR